MPLRARYDNPTTRRIAWRLTAWAVLLLLVGLPVSARYQQQVQDTEPGDADRPSPWTQDLAREVGIIEKVNSPVPTDLTLIDEDGGPIRLGDLFEEGRPVVFNLGYARCPSICIQMRSQLADQLPDAGLKLGEDVIILNVSIDPEETPEQSRDLRTQVFAQLEDNGVEPSAEGWRFLTADADTIAKLTDALGYRYLYIEPQNEYGHPGVLVLADGGGTIRRYLNGTAYSGKTLRLSVVETSDGKVGSLLDKAFVTCFVWDPEANNYAATAKFIMMVGGGVTMLLIVGLVLAGFAYEKRRRRLMQTNDKDLGEMLPAT